MGLGALILSAVSVLLVQSGCPHENFVQNNLCDSCRGWKEVLRHQKSLGVTGITTVLGPPVHTFPPLFRQTGPYQGDYITVQYSTVQYITLHYITRETTAS